MPSGATATEFLPTRVICDPITLTVWYHRHVTCVELSTSCTTVWTVSTPVQLCNSQQQHGLYNILHYEQWYGLFLYTERLCSCKTDAVFNETFVHSKQLHDFSPLLNVLCSVRSDDVNPLLQTVHSNILILLQFISCVAVHTTFMSVQVAGLAKTSVTQWTLVRLLSRVDPQVTL